MKTSPCRAYLLLPLVLLMSFSDLKAQPDPPRMGGPQQAGGKPLEWTEFSSVAGGFSVKFPASPEVKKAPFTKGPLTFERHTHTSSLGDILSFEVDYMDLPAGFDDPELTLEASVASMVQAMVLKGGRVLTRETITHGACVGREVTIAMPKSVGDNEGLAHARTFRSGQRFFILVFYAMSSSTITRQLGRTFMDSFSVKDGCSAGLSPAIAPTVNPTKTKIEGTLDRATGWRRIDMTQHGFSVLMPGDVERESEQAQVQPIVLFHHTYTSENNDLFSSAEVIGDYPPEFFSGAAQFAAQLDVLLFAIKRNVEPSGFVLENLRDLKIGNYPGREYKLTNKKMGARGRAQLYALPKRLYIFIAFETGSKQQPDVLDRFFSSIRITVP